MKTSACRLLIGAVGVVGVARASEAATTSLCSAQETTYLSCTTARKRQLSLCGHAPQSLQYRYGRSAAIQLQFPESAADGAQKMLYAHYNRYRTARVEVRFENAGAEYVLFDYREGKRRSAGVRVTAADGKERALACVGRIESRLGELQSALPCDTDSALNSGGCR